MNNDIQQKQTELFKSMGAFFAFSTDQFLESKVEGVNYLRIKNLGGLICPKENVDKLLNELEKIHLESIKKDLEENDLKSIIKRELYNHEAFYTGDIEDTFLALSIYKVKKEQVLEVYLEERKNFDC